MAIELSTAGIKLGYGVETTAGTKPATWTNIPDPKSIPEINPEPSQLQTTSLNATEWHTYIDSLKDMGGALGITFNDTEAFHTAWETLVEADATAKEGGKATWFQVLIPGLTKSFYFVGTPSALGFGGAEVDGVLEISAYVTPNSIKGWDTKSSF